MRARKSEKSRLFSAILTIGISLVSTISLAGSNPPVQELLQIDSVYNKARAEFEAYALNVYQDLGDDEINYQNQIKALSF